MHKSIRENAYLQQEVLQPEALNPGFGLKCRYVKTIETLKPENLQPHTPPKTLKEPLWVQFPQKDESQQHTP